jgi:S1-C subfamily serine protease
LKRVCLLLIFAVLIAFCVSAYADQNAEERLKAVVKIHSLIPEHALTARSLGTEREGNGVVIDSNGHILTIGYLILEAETIEVLGPEGRPLKATFVGYDHETGFGLLQAEKPLNVEPMGLGQSSEIEEGDPILIASHGGSDSVQGSRVLSRREFAGYWEYLLEDAIFTTPPYLNYGGAALIGRDGRLLGIGSLFTQVVVPGLGAIPCNMFVPIDLLKPILPDLMASGRSQAPPRPWLGLHAEETRGRVFVLRVTSGGPAKRAGVQPDDMILTVNRVAIKGLVDFYRSVWALGAAGVDVPLTVLQGTEIRNITLHSADRYQFLKLKPQRGKGQTSF